MDFSKDYEIKIYKNKCAFSNMKDIGRCFFIEEIRHYAGKNKTNICKKFSYNFRDYFKIDSSMFYRVNRYPNNRKLYLINYLDYEYLVCSKAFKDNDVYIIAANKDNYLHLTGVKTKLPPFKLILLSAAFIKEPFAAPFVL